MKKYLAVILATLVVQPALAGEKEKQMVAEMAIRCMGIPNLEQMSKVAEAMKLQFIGANTQNPPGGGVVHDASWVLAGDSKGPFKWTGAEASLPSGFISQCGIGAVEVDMEALKQELKLGEPTSVVQAGPSLTMNWALTKTYPLRRIQIEHGTPPGQQKPITMIWDSYKFEKRPEFFK